MRPTSKRGESAIYLLAGHTHTKRDIALETVLAACGKPAPIVAYVGAASSDSNFVFNLATKSLLDAGAGKVLFVKLLSKRNSISRARDILEESDIIHMGGGDVEKGMSIIHGRDLAPFLRKQKEMGKLFFGLSAGSIMLARSWVRWCDPKDDDSAQVFPCMDFAPVYCDTHAESENFSELQILLGLIPGSAVGYGIPSGAGLKVTEKGRVSAIGKSVWKFKKKSGGIVRVGDLEI